MKPKHPPKHLKADGRTLWREVVAEYHLEDAAGLALLTTAAECLDRIRQAQAVIEKQGPVVLDRYGQQKVAPACILERDSRNGLLAALKALNLDLEPLRDRPGRPTAPLGVMEVRQ